jgi:hypothetical protein
LALQWVGLVLALGGGVIAVIAGFQRHWEVAIIGGIVFIVGMFALTHGRKSPD